MRKGVLLDVISFSTGSLQWLGQLSKFPQSTEAQKKTLKIDAWM